LAEPESTPELSQVVGLIEPGPAPTLGAVRAGGIAHLVADEVVATLVSDTGPGSR